MYNVIDKHVATERKFPQVSKASARLAEGFQWCSKKELRCMGEYNIQLRHVKRLFWNELKDTTILLEWPNLNNDKYQ